MKDPRYIRLADHLTSGMVADIESGFAISGYDVQPFPSDPWQAAFVRGLLRSGRLEAAGKAEYLEVHPDVEYVAPVDREGKPIHQEHLLREAAARAAAEDADAADEEDEDDEDELEEGDDSDESEDTDEDDEDEEEDEEEEDDESPATEAPAQEPQEAAKATRRGKS